MPVSFNNIPANIRVPLFYAEVDNAHANQFTQTNRALLIGQKLASGSATADVPVLCSTEDQAKALAGLGSPLARMMAAFRANDPFTEVWLLPLADNGSGVKATGELAITGPATAAGTLNLYIGGQRVQIAVASGDTATEIGDAIVAALGANEAAALAAGSEVPVTAANTTGTVTLTARNAGEVGNDIDLRLNYLGALGGESTPAGVSVAITAMANGATNPVLTTGLANVGDELFDYIGLSFTDTTTLAAVGTFLNDTAGRWSYAQQLYGHAFAVKADSLANLQTFGAARNDQHVTVFGIDGSPTPAYEIAAAACAQAAKSLSIDPARPLQTLPLLGVKAPAEADRFIMTERQTLLSTGVATTYIESGTVRIERAITTYQENAWGQPDTSYLDVTTMATLAYILRFLKSRITSKFPRHKLANDGTRFGDGQAVVTPNVIRSEIVAGYAELESLALVENREAFAANLVVERNQNDPNRVDVLYPPDLVNQLRIFAVLAQFRLQYPATA